MRARRLLLPLAALGLLLTSGCAGPVPEPDSSGSAAAGEAFFASEEEAVEAALAVYAEYAATADAIMADGGARPERLEPYADKELFESQLASFEKMRDDQAVGSGATSFSIHEWQQDPVLDRTGVFLSAYMCRDVSDTGVFGPNGEDLVSPDRYDVIATEVLWTVSEDGTVKVSKDAPWLPENFCL